MTKSLPWIFQGLLFVPAVFCPRAGKHKRTDFSDSLLPLPNCWSSSPGCHNPVLCDRRWSRSPCYAPWWHERSTRPLRPSRPQTKSLKNTLQYNTFCVNGKANKLNERLQSIEDQFKIIQGPVDHTRRLSSHSIPDSLTALLDIRPLDICPKWMDNKSLDASITEQKNERFTGKPHYPADG